MPPEDTDLEADVRAAIEGPAEPATETPAAPVEAGPSRDEHGRFAPKVDNKAEVTQPSASEAPQQPGTILPPYGWSAANKAKFAALDPDVQQEVLRREREMEDAKKQWDSKGEQLNRFQALYEPIKDRLTLSGIDQYAYTQALIRADELLRTNPQQALVQLSQMYGINFPGIQPQQQPYVDPTLSALQQQVQQLTQHITSQNTAKEQAEMAEVSGQIAAFREDPKHPYFDNVKDDMALLLERGKAKALDDAYEMACRLNPEVWAVMQAKPVTPARKGTPRDISVTGSPGQTQPVRQVNSRASHEDDVRAALEELAGRV